MNEINRTVFPRFQCSTNNRHMLGMATTFLQARLPEFVAQQELVVRCAKLMSNRMIEKGYNVVSGGTDNHLLVIDLRGTGVDGARLERVLELCGIDTNRNVIPGEKPGSRMGIRFGTAAMISRGFSENDFEWLVDIVDCAITLTASISEDVRVAMNGDAGEGTTVNYKAFLAHLGDGDSIVEIVRLREEVLIKGQRHPTPW